MIEYTDGTTSEPGQLHAIMERLTDELSDPDAEKTPAALHIGDRDELAARRDEASARTEMEERLDTLEAKLDRIKERVDQSLSPRGSFRGGRANARRGPSVYRRASTHRHTCGRCPTRPNDARAPRHDYRGD